jgi:hypothetical protein
VTEQQDLARREFITRAFWGSLRTVGCLAGFAVGAFAFLALAAIVGWLQ